MTSEDEARRAEILFLLDTSDPKSVIDLLSEVELRRVIDWALKTLPKRDREVMELRYGLHDETGETMTLSEIARRRKRSPERIRQIEMRSLRRLRHPFRAMPLLVALGVVTRD